MVGGEVKWIISIKWRSTTFPTIHHHRHLSSCNALNTTEVVLCPGWPLQGSAIAGVVASAIRIVASYLAFTVCARLDVPKSAYSERCFPSNA